MKSKHIIFILAFVLAFALVSCDINEGAENGQDAVATTTTATQTTTTTVTTTLAPEPFDYKQIECKSVTEWKDVGFAIEGSDSVLLVSLPADWDLEQHGDGYYAFVGGGSVAEISTEIPSGNYDILHSSTHKNGNVEADYDERVIHDEWGDLYNRVIGFWLLDGELNSLYLSLDYDALDDAAIAHILESMRFGDRGGGELYLDLDKYNSSNKILIIGNSFVGDKFSGISITLDQMLKNGKKTDYVFENITIYNKSIKDYTKEPYISDMANGKYKLVFMCGIYSKTDVEAMQLAIDACAKSNTGLVFFIAHNEREQWIQEAMARYPDEMYLDWRTEISSFIHSDAIYWQFCMNDGPRHSTPLGGYIGAHMIYKAVFREIPPKHQSSSILSYEKVKSMLGNYPETGVYDGEYTYPVYEVASQK